MWSWQKTSEAVTRGLEVWPNTHPSKATFFCDSSFVWQGDDWRATTADRIDNRWTVRRCYRDYFKNLSVALRTYQGNSVTIYELLDSPSRGTIINKDIVKDNIMRLEEQKNLFQRTPWWRREKRNLISYVSGSNLPKDLEKILMWKTV